MADIKPDLVDMREDAPEDTPTPYPCGLSLRLEADQLAKLGIDRLPCIGDEYHIRAVGKVTMVAQQSYDAEDAAMSVQITMLQMIHEDDINGDDDTPASENAGEANINQGKAPESTGVRTAMSTSYRGM